MAHCVSGSVRYSPVIGLEIQVCRICTNPHNIFDVEWSSQTAVSFYSAAIVWIECRDNLVDPASSHMLVSKIKPCMFKCKSTKAKL